MRLGSAQARLVVLAVLCAADPATSIVAVQTMLFCCGAGVLCRGAVPEVHCSLTGDDTGVPL